MSEIKRYKLEYTDMGFRQGFSDMQKHPNGEWVRWDDVKDLIDLARDAVTLKVFQEFERDNDPTPP